MGTEKRIIYDGYPSAEEIRQANGWPEEERWEKGPVAVVECVQQIPCNPCEGACPFHAIQIGNPITNTPRVDTEKCVGCGMCVAACPGLAIFVVDKSLGNGLAAVSFPFEYVPLPQKGDQVDALSRAGEFVCKAEVIKVMNPERNDHTPVITLAVPKEYADQVRTMRRLRLPEKGEGFHKAEKDEILDDDVIVCRCEEITAGEIRKAIREYKATTVTEVKRRVRAGMGLCQGRTCGKIVARMIAEETGKPMSEILGSTDRPPVRPVSFGELAADKEESDDERDNV